MPSHRSAATARAIAAHVAGTLGLACFLALACVPAAARAQEARDPRAVQPERPTVATHAYAVAPGYVEVEAGAQYQNPAGGSETDLPVVVKIGLTPRIQLELADAWSESHPTPGGGLRGGPGDLSAAVKFRVATLPLLGDFSVQPALKLPTGSTGRGTGTGTTDGSLLLIASHPIGPGEIDVNAGYTARTGDGTQAPRSATVWAVSGGVSLPRNVGWVTEVFGYPGTSGPAGSAPQVGLLFGPTFAARKSLVFDAGAIVNLEGLGGNSVYVGVTANLGRWFGR